jgi:glucosamine--fructose-6-phosphate aminotransferase (isomerizing)
MSLLLAIASKLGYANGFDVIPQEIEGLISDNEERIMRLSKKLAGKRDIFVIGKGLSYPVAREIALKLKEIPYIHAEGMMAGELKHGTIALIEPGVPVISLIPNMSADMISSTREVQARGADVIKISHEEGDLIVPRSDDVHFALYAAILGHLLSYHIAKELGREIDKPRNLAKSVTVK